MFSLELLVMQTVFIFIVQNSVIINGEYHHQLTVFLGHNLYLASQLII